MIDGTKMSVGHYADGCWCASCLTIRNKRLCTHCAGTKIDVQGVQCPNCGGFGTHAAEVMTLERRAQFVRDNYPAHLQDDDGDDDYFDGVSWGKRRWSAPLMG